MRSIIAFTFGLAAGAVLAGATGIWLFKEDINAIDFNSTFGADAPKSPTTFETDEGGQAS